MNEKNNDANRASSAKADMADAYVGAREDLAIWKKRALEAEESCRRLVSALNSESGPTFMGEPAATPASDTRAAVPDGWKLVPLEPTKEMLIAMGKAVWVRHPADQQMHHVYAAMLAAAPTAAIAEADAKDAARYRYLREQARSVDWSHKWTNNTFSTHCRTSASQMDRVIDAAMSATQQAQNSAKGSETDE